MIRKKSKKVKKYLIFKQNYFAFSKHIVRQIVKNKEFFKKMLLFMVVTSIILIGIMPQNSYNNFRKIVQNTQKESGPSSAIKTANTMFLATFDTGGLGNLNDRTNNIYLMIILILSWMAVVKYFRVTLGKKKIDFKDVLYSCGSSIIGFLINLFILIIKMIPSAILIIIYSVFRTSIYFRSGVNLIVLIIIFILLISFNFYWAIPSVLSLVTITLPGMYPLKSINFAKNLVDGQRAKVVFRLLWHFLTVAIVWFVVMLPIITIDNLLVSKIKWFSGIPFIPIIMIIMTMVSILWTYTYFYFIYRRLLENDPTFKRPSKK